MTSRGTSCSLVAGAATIRRRRPTDRRPPPPATRPPARSSRQPRAGREVSIGWTRQTNDVPRGSSSGVAQRAAECRGAGGARCAARSATSGPMPMPSSTTVRRSSWSSTSTISPVVGGVARQVRRASRSTGVTSTRRVAPPPSTGPTVCTRVELQQRCVLTGEVPQVRAATARRRGAGARRSCRGCPDRRVQPVDRLVDPGEHLGVAEGGALQLQSRGE